MPDRDCAYTVDRNGIIRHVNDGWIAFARANGAPDLAHRVIGTPLDMYIAGAEVRYLYDLLYDTVRRTQRTVQVPFRNDAPGVRRSYLLTIAPGDAGGLTFSSRPLSEQPRPAVHLLRGSTTLADEYLTMCSWCKRIRIGSGWVDPEEAAGKLRLYLRGPLPSVSYGVCSRCEATATGLVHSAPTSDT